MTATLIYKVDATLGEGAIWNYISKELYWIDIEAKCLNVFNPLNNENISFYLHKKIGTIVPAGDKKILLALEDGIAILNLPQGDLEYKIQTVIHKENKRFNDGKCDPQGRFWVGSLSNGKVSNDNKMYCITNDFNIVEKLTELSISNGIAWTADSKIMYHIDTPTGEVTSHNFDKCSGNIFNKQVVIKIPSEMGYPDGMTIDSDGMLWIALWDGFCVAKYNPFSGELLQKISVPAPKVTSCAFGGDNLNILYITTARIEMTDEELLNYPLSGSLFHIELDVKGLPAFSFNLE